MEPVDPRIDPRLVPPGARAIVQAADRRHGERRGADRRADTFACPACGNHTSKVVDSRGVLSRQSLRRRRECTACGARYSTIERIVLGSIVASHNRL